MQILPNNPLYSATPHLPHRPAVNKFSELTKGIFGKRDQRENRYSKSNIKQLSQVLSQIDINEFFKLYPIHPEHLKKLSSFMAHCQTHMLSVRSQDARVAAQSILPPTSRTLDGLLLAISIFSATQEQEGPWQSLQTLQIYAAILLSPFIITPTLDAVFSEISDVKGWQVLLSTYLIMGIAYVALNAYQKHFQPIPMSVKPLFNLTRAAQEGRFDPLICRDKIIDEIFQCWEGTSRETRLNPILIGPPGVGKTAIMTEIARRIASLQVSNPFKNKVMFSGTAAAFLPAGPLDDDNKLERTFKRLEHHKHHLIFAIDEVAKLFNPEHRTSCGFTLQSKLDTGPDSFPYFLGLTSEEDYRQYMAKDAAITRRFHPIFVTPTTELETNLILRQMARREADGISVSDEAFTAAYQQTLDLGYHQPDIAKRIFSIALTHLKQEEKRAPSSSELQLKKTEKIDLYARFDSQFHHLDQNHYLHSLQQIEEDISKLEKQCQKETDERLELKSLLKQQTDLQDALFKLALKLEKKATDKKLKCFMHLYFHERPLLEEKRESLILKNKVSILDETLISKVIDHFKSEQKKISAEENQ